MHTTPTRVQTALPGPAEQRRVTPRRPTDRPTTCSCRSFATTGPNGMLQRARRSWRTTVAVGSSSLGHSLAGRADGRHENLANTPYVVCCRASRVRGSSYRFQNHSLRRLHRRRLWCCRTTVVTTRRSSARSRYPT